MENISYVGMSHQVALKQQMELVANNIANMSTPGFKSQSVLFEEFLVESDKRNEDRGELSQVLDRATWRNTGQGPMSRTNNPLDLALNGAGYFEIDTPGGLRYTRAGNFALNDQGEIVTQKGHPLMSDAGRPIVIPEGAGNITVDSKGFVSTEQGPIAQIKTVAFANEQQMIETGDGLYISGNNAEIESEDLTVSQGALESSNVNGVLEMTKMIEIMRTYQSVQRMLQTDHDRQRSTIRTLSEVN